MIAVQGPDRSGSGAGVPVPSRTICVTEDDLSCENVSEENANTNGSTIEPCTTR